MKARTVSVTVALLGIAALCALLVVDSVRRTKRHEATASQVLHDYAALGAEAVGQRLQSALAGRMFTVVGALGDSLPATRAAFREWVAPAPRLLADSLSWVGQFRATTTEPVGDLKIVRFEGALAPDTHLADSIRALAGRMPASAYMGTFLLRDQVIVFAKPRAGATAGVYALSTSALASLVQRLINNDPVLPRAITHGVALDTNVQVDVKRGDTRLATRGNSGASPYSAQFPIDGLFDGFSVVVTLATSLAPSLIAGGVPSSSRPLLIAVTALTVALVSVALYELRQRDRFMRLREDFVAGTSHELRTPLAQIRLFAETLRLERVRTDQERVHAIAVIEREAKRLEHLVDNLLHFSRDDAMVRHEHREIVNASKLTREIVAEFSPLAAKGDVTIVMAGNTSFTADVDAVAWRQILINLLDNAVKYGGRRATVTVELAEDEHEVLLVVTDQGPGVPEAERLDIWKKFWRSESSRAAGISGTGIGLATVHDLVAQLGGVCFVEDATTSGARFQVRVPRAA